MVISCVDSDQEFNKGVTCDQIGFIAFRHVPEILHDQRLGLALQRENVRDNSRTGACGRTSVVLADALAVSFARLSGGGLTQDFKVVQLHKKHRSFMNMPPSKKQAHLSDWKTHMLRMPRPCLIGGSFGKHMDCAWPHAHEGMGAGALASMHVHCNPADESACGGTEHCPGGGGQQSDSQPCTLKTKSYLAQKPLHVAERDTGDEGCLLFWTPPPSLCHTARVKSTESAAGAEV